MFALSLFALLPIAIAQSIDNSAASNSIQAQAQQFNGNFRLTNAATSQILSFTRESVTNFYTRGDSVSVNLQQVSGDGMSGTVISGLGKCASAQWGFQQGAQAQGGQFNHAAVSYACQIGSSDQNNGNIHVAKQIWQIVPCGSSSPGSNSIQLATHNKGHPKKPPTVQGGGSSGKKCRKSGKWLAKHWQYVYGKGHKECESRLQQYWHSGHHRMSRLSKRVLPSSDLGSRSEVTHEHFEKLIKSRELVKRGGGQAYCLVASDHLNDMATRALSSGSMATFGGYTSQRLESYNPNDLNQQWYITPA